MVLWLTAFVEWNWLMISKYRIDELVPLLSWEHFFFTWNVRMGTEESCQLKTEALLMLSSMEPSLSVECICQPFDAYAEGDDIVLGQTHIPFLRQQIPNAEGYCLCMSDFMTTEKHSPDRIYLFATTVRDKSLEDTNDPYSRLLRQTLSDRLAEAAAEHMQQLMEERQELCGHIIRPAVGYPMIPDMSVNFLLDELIDFSSIGIQLTENGMMQPHASVSGFVIANPEAKYFSIGSVSQEQLTDYAQRRGLSVSAMTKFINLSI